MQNMAEVSAETHSGKTHRTWERSATRQAILDAARRMAARDGTEAITLSSVAAEAGFAPPAVYAYFVSKDDLYLAVVADDLNKLARSMRGEADAAPEAPQAEDTAAEAGDGEVVALHPAAPGEAENGHESAEAATQEPAVGQTGDVEPVQVGSGEEKPAVDISLAEIEQAIGVVLASPGADYVADAAVLHEDIPDAFPEEAIEDAEETEAAEHEEEDGFTEYDQADASLTDSLPGDASRVERRAEPGAPRLRMRLRRSRRDGANSQLAMPLESAEQDLPKPAAPPSTKEEMAAAIVELQQTVARLESRPADAWLERRLRVFERTLTDIEGRMEKAERDSGTALSAVSNGFKALEHRLNETLDTATQRSSESEQRHRAVAADLRMYVKDLSGRLGVLEKSVSRMLGDGTETMSMRAAAYVPFEAPEAHPEHEDEGDADRGAKALDEESDAKPESESYLANARRAARSAAAQAEVERVRGPLSYLKMPSVGASGLPLSRRTLHLIAGGLILVVLLIVASIALRNNASAPPAPAAEVTRPIAQTPDERIVALAKAGNPKAELIVALKMLNGDGMASDVPSAAHWLQRSAVRGEPVAEYWLGTLFERGHGVARDQVKAMHWYEQAAKAGNAKAMYRLGVAEAAGWAGEPNYVEAGNWFTKAAALGVIDAQFNLAVLYERGSGVPQSLKEAFKWYAIAAAHGDAESKSRIDALATQITSDDVAQAQAEAAKFRPAEPDPEANAEPDLLAVAQSK